MDSLQRAVLATEVLTERYGLDPIFLEALKTQSGEPITRLRQQCDAMADVLWAVAQGPPPQPSPYEGEGERPYGPLPEDEGGRPSPPAPLPEGEGRKTR